MNTNANRASDPYPSLDRLARFLMDDAHGPDALAELIEPLATLLAPALFAHLCEMLDFCPEHLTDIDSCYDDELDCRADPNA